MIYCPPLNQDIHFSIYFNLFIIDFQTATTPTKKKRMGRISISETQFAFAFFHKYLLLHKDEDITFCFPTLRQEGDPRNDYAGADLVVANNVFIQFKMPDFLRRRNSTEIISGSLYDDFAPYYRFNIKNSGPSNQFNLLKNAARNPINIVRYISPMFHTDGQQSDDDAFNNFFGRSPLDSMNYICSIPFDQFVQQPETNLTSDNSHKICYNAASVLDGYAFLFSEPKPIIAQKGLSEFNNQELIFNDSHAYFQTIERTLSYVRETFLIDNQTDHNSALSIERLQIQLLIKHDVFWIPVFRNRIKRRARKIRGVVSKNE
jgi:hypothetical protein